MDEVGEDLAGTGRVERVRGVHLEISASEIRRRVAASESIRYLTPEPVERYIYARGLYTS